VLLLALVKSSKHLLVDIIDTVPDLPYFIRRTQYHGFPVSVQRKKSSLTHTHLDRIDGDIWVSTKMLAHFD